MKKICKIFENLQKNMQKHEKKTHYGYIPKKSMKKNEKQCFMFHRSLFFSNTREFEM